MTDVLNIHEAKTHLSRIVERVSGGETIVIAKAGKPVAKIVPLDEKKTASNRVGFLVGQVDVPGDFDTMADEEIMQQFEGHTD